MNLFSRASHTGRCKHTNEDHGWLQGFKLLAQYMTRCVTENSWSDLSWPPQTTCHIADTFERAAAEHMSAYFWSTKLLYRFAGSDSMSSGLGDAHGFWLTKSTCHVVYNSTIWGTSGRHMESIWEASKTKVLDNLMSELQWQGLRDWVTYTTISGQDNAACSDKSLLDTQLVQRPASIKKMQPQGMNFARF